MSANFELNIDHQIIEVSAWDIVSLGEFEELLEEIATLPDDLGRTIQYIDFGQATEVVICQLGAIQIARSFEKLMDRGLRGCVIHAPQGAIHEAARMIISTFTAVCGDLPEGYRLSSLPLEIKSVRSYLHSVEERIRLVA